MGIPKFNKWVRYHTVGVMSSTIPTGVSSLAFDLNQILHRAAQETFYYGETDDPTRQLQQRLELKARIERKEVFIGALFFEAVGELMMDIIRRVNPLELLIIAIDGVVSAAKLYQQRQRRFKHSFDPNTEVFDSSWLTPGTDIMMALDTYIPKWIDANKEFLPSTIIYSGCMSPGEGEHKIAEIYRTAQTTFSYGNHLIYGLDADLYVIASLLYDTSRIKSGFFLYREEVRNGRRMVNVVNIDQFRKNTTLVPADFCFFMSLVGNDFLPALSCFNDMESAMQILGKTQGLRVVDVQRASDTILTDIRNKVTINYNALLSFFEVLTTMEEDLIEDQLDTVWNFPSPIVEQSTIELGLCKFIDYELYRRYWYGSTLNPKNEGLNMSCEDRIDGMCREYIRGMIWIMEYYRAGMMSCNPMYVYRYSRAPLAMDLARVLRYDLSHDLRYVDDLYDKVDYSVFTPLHQLISVLPRRSLSLIPQKYSQYESIALKQLPELYPDEFDTEIYAKQNDWQGTAILPYVNLAKVVDVIGVPPQDFEWKPDFTRIQNGGSRVTYRQPKPTKEIVQESVASSQLGKKVLEEKKRGKSAGVIIPLRR